MIPRLDTIVEAYHGTNSFGAKMVRQQGFLRCTTGKNRKLFLGDGVYFYENSLEHAKRWAERKFSKSDVVVLHSKVKLGYCLSFDAVECFEDLQDLRDFLVEEGYDERKLSEGFLVNYLASQAAEEGMTIDTVRMTHRSNEGYSGTLFPGSIIHSGSQMILCVRNLENISQPEVVYPRQTKL